MGDSHSPEEIAEAIKVSSDTDIDTLENVARRYKDIMRNKDPVLKKHHWSFADCYGRSAGSG